jgi:5'-phosphate synthase pdxT subunit
MLIMSYFVTAVPGLCLGGSFDHWMRRIGYWRRFAARDSLPARILKEPPHCLPVLGTCAGCILLARRIRTFDDQPRIGCLEVEVERNAYGPQIESFECQVQNVQVFGEEPLRAVLIRAPVITRVLDSARVQVLASFRDTPIVVQQDHILACTFHPELTGDTRIHRRFIEIVKQNIAVERRLN